MTNKINLIINTNKYNQLIRYLNFVNYVYLDEIRKFKFSMISKYYNSIYIYDEILKDFNIINELIIKKDIFNAIAILRTTYENIIYIIATSYDKKIIINENTMPGKLREIVENNCDKIFPLFFEKDDFNLIYSYLCKLLHPSNIKELMSYLSKKKQYQEYLLNNIKYILLIIEYMYISFLNNRIGVVDSFDLDQLELCTYINLLNLQKYIEKIDKSDRFLKRYLYMETKTKFVTDTKNNLELINKELQNNPESFEININQLAKNIDKEIKNRNYMEIFNEILY